MNLSMEYFDIQGYAVIWVLCVQKVRGEDRYHSHICALNVKLMSAAD